MPLTHSDPTQWTCPHGVTYTGSDDFISGARNAHDELRNSALVKLAELEKPDDSVLVDARLLDGWRAALSAVREAFGLED